ncbi:MAG: signal transduction histidine kinase/ActR/RegA family two-component response regulator [Planctomycetota bacterium]|jgi:signal transduction histidine kinase/ActR/RegA family two-component response regulator
MSDTRVRLFELMESFSTPAIAVDYDGHIALSNTRARSVFELSESDLEGQHLSSICSLNSDSPHLETPTWCTASGGTRFVAQVTTLATRIPGEQLDIHLFREIQGVPRIGQRFEDSLLKIARAPEFISGDIDGAADLLTETIARTLQVERVGYWLLTEDRELLVCRSLFELSSERHSRGTHLSSSDYPAYFDALEGGRAIAVDDPENDPRTKEFAGDYLSDLGITSMLDAVIRVSGKMVGVVCHEHVGQSRKWLSDEITFAGEVADQAAHAYLIAKNLQSQAERDRLTSELQQTQRLDAVGRLAGGVAHDFNNLLSVVLGNAELGMRSGHLETKSCLEEIHSAGKRAAALTSQLLSVGRRQVLKPSAIDANELISGLLSLVRSVVPESIELNLSLVEEPGLVYADGGQLEQVLMNLCLNARDAINGEGRITIGTQIEDHETGDDWLILSVEDDGAGIPEEVLDHIFDPFFTTKEEGRGTGLGLPMVYGIATQHGGRVSATSHPGLGSRFEIRLPRTQIKPTESLDPICTDSSITGVTPAHILVAEDDESLRRLTKRVLEHAGFRVSTAIDGADVVEKHAAAVGSYQLVLIDVIMPRRNGPAALEIIRRKEPNLPALFTTGYGSEALSQDIFQREGARVLLKPVPGDELVQAVRDCLSMAQQSER